MNNIWKGIGCAVTFGMMAGCASDTRNDLPISDEKIEAYGPDIGLRGPDQNANGVRDYIEDYLVNTYAENDEQEKVLLALAESVQFMIENAEDYDALYKDAVSSDPFIGCLVAFENMNSELVLEEIEALSTNTNERYQRYALANATIGGSVARLSSYEDSRAICPSYYSG